MKLNRQLTHRERGLLLVLAVLLVFAVYFLYVHIPVTEDLESARSQSEAAATEVTVLEAKQARMDQMQQELDTILSQPNVAEIPTYDNLQRVMDFLNTVLSSTTDYSLSFQGLKKSEDSVILRREMLLSYVSSSYDEARDVLEQLQNCPFRCQIGEASIEPFIPKGQGQDKAVSPALTDGPVQVSLAVTFFENAR